MKGYCDNIEKRTVENDDFRHVLYTGHNLQLVLMTLSPARKSEQRSTKTATNSSASRKVQARLIDGVENKVEDDFGVIVPAGARHNVRNTGTAASAALHDLRPARASRRAREGDQGRGRGRPRGMGRQDDRVARSRSQPFRGRRRAAAAWSRSGCARHIRRGCRARSAGRRRGTAPRPSCDA